MKEQSHRGQENSKLMVAPDMCILTAAGFKPCSKEQWKITKGL